VDGVVELTVNVTLGSFRVPGSAAADVISFAKPERALINGIYTTIAMVGYNVG